jgi:transposase
MSYDIKFRERAIAYLEKGHSWVETTTAFGISEYTLNRWLKKKAAGDLSDTPVRTRKRKIASEALKAYVAENPDAYQAEMAEFFGCSQQAICMALKRNGISRKKRQNDIKNKILKK